MPRVALRIIRDEHAALAAVLRSLTALLEMGPREDPQRFFDVLRAMLFYIDEFPERRHHPNETNLLFPALARKAPELMPVIERLESDHSAGEGKVRELQHLLLAWEFLGEARQPAFVSAVQAYVRFYLQHMQLEESQILPAAQAHLSDDDWAKLDARFEQDRDPLSGGVRDPQYDRLFSRIVLTAPAPVGLGSE